MNSHGQRLERLFNRARRSPKPSAEEASSPPFGFATSVAARWAGSRQRPSQRDAWERLCWWGAGAAAAICLSATVYHTLLPEADVFDSFVYIQADSDDLL